MADHVENSVRTSYEAARNYANLKDDENAAVAARKKQGEETLLVMQDSGDKKIKVDFDEDRDATVSIKVRERSVFDEGRLKKALGAKVYSKLTTPVLDEAKVEAAIKLGEVDPNVVSSCLVTTETPYLEARFTKKRR